MLGLWPGEPQKGARGLPQDLGRGTQYGRDTVCAGGGLAVTRDEALRAKTIHSNGCYVIFGPRGGIYYNVFWWSSSGRTRTWKRQPDKFVRTFNKGSRYSKGTYLTNENLNSFHSHYSCPVSLILKKHARIALLVGNKAAAILLHNDPSYLEM